MIDQIQAAHDGALARLATAGSSDEVRAVELEVLGKKGSLTDLKAGLGKLATIEEKKDAGRALNEASAAVSEALQARLGEFRRAERTVQLEAERLDLTEILRQPGRGHAHVVTQAWQRLEDVFVGLGFQVAEGPEVETDWYNFEALNMPADHPARSMHDTFYVDHGEPGSTVLRTHTSPVQIRVMQNARSRRSTWSCPAACSATTPPTPPTCRSSTRSRAWSSTAASRSPTSPARSSRSRRRSSARTSPAACGRATSPSPSRRPSSTSARRRATGSSSAAAAWCTPTCCAPAASTPRSAAGFAFGFGIDRMAKERHGIDDVREMYTNDIRFIEQF